MDVSSVRSSQKAPQVECCSGFGAVASATISLGAIGTIGATIGAITLNPIAAIVACVVAAFFLGCFTAAAITSFFALKGSEFSEKLLAERVSKEETTISDYFRTIGTHLQVIIPAALTLGATTLCAAVGEGVVTGTRNKFARAIGGDDRTIRVNHHYS